MFSPTKSTAIVSDRVFTENPVWGQNALIKELEKLLMELIYVRDFAKKADFPIESISSNSIL